MSPPLSPKENVQRFVHTNGYNGVFYTGNFELNFDKVDHTPIKDYIKQSPGRFIKTIIELNRDAYLVRRKNLFYLLAFVLSSQDERAVIPPEIIKDMKKLILDLAKTPEEFFYFIKYFTILDKNKSKISTFLRKLIVAFYNSKKPIELANLVASRDTYHNWQHKDLIKLCHYKPNENAAAVVVEYVLFGIKKLEERNNPEFAEIVTVLKKSHELRTTENVSTAVNLINDLHASINQVNSKLNKNEEVWAATLSFMTPREILQKLHKFYKHGWLKSGSVILNKVIEALNDQQRVKDCNLHPVEVFVYLKFFEKGGKKLDPRLIAFLRKQLNNEEMEKLTTSQEPKCGIVITNINKCLMLSYNNVKPIGKKFLITIDVREKSDVGCLHNKMIPTLEAAYTLIRFFTKVEKNVSVMVFADKTVQPMDLSKCYSFGQAVEKLQSHKAAYILPQAPLEWATHKKKNVDVFINIMSGNCGHVSQDKIEKPEVSLEKYRSAMNSPNTKLVRMFLSTLASTLSDAHKDILTINGFTVEVPRVLEAFFRNCFC